LTTDAGGATLLILLLILKTITRKILLPLTVLLVWAPSAYGWSWPVQGPVLQPFAYDESHPYTDGQHRGIDIGADAAGEQVVAPAAGTVSFAGSVPTNGECVTIQTSAGYTVTLTHLGTLLVAKGSPIAEGQAVATIGPSGTPEFDRPYVHLGLRATSDPNGYLDPLSLLPPPAEQTAPAQGDPAAAPQPSTNSASASAPAQLAPAPAAAASAPPSVGTTRGSTVAPSTSRSSAHQHPRMQKPRSKTRAQRPSQRPASHHESRNTRLRLQHRRASVQASTAQASTAQASTAQASMGQRPLLETTVTRRPEGLAAGREIQPAASLLRPSATPHSVASPMSLVLNGGAALVALAAALLARRRRSPTAPAELLHLPRPVLARRAA
jgi:MYXO-CTERM domain-containing protein